VSGVFGPTAALALTCRTVDVSGVLAATITILSVGSKGRTETGSTGSPISSTRHPISSTGSPISNGCGWEAVGSVCTRVGGASRAQGWGERVQLHGRLRAVDLHRIVHAQAGARAGAGEVLILMRIVMEALTRHGVMEALTRHGSVEAFAGRGGRQPCTGHGSVKVST